jgi:predicted permease
MLGELYRRIQYLMTRRRRAQELEDEMAVHREMARRDGAAVPFGNDLRLREDAHDVWGWTWLDRLGQDVRYALRMLRRSPGFTVVAIAVLAIGVGANVAAFGFFNLLVLRPLPVREPETILRLERRSPSAYAGSVTYPELAFVRDHATTLSAVMGWTTAKLTPDHDNRPISAQFVTANLFDDLGAPMRLGRGLSPRDADPTADPVAVLAHGCWLRRFGGDPAVVGRVVHLNGQPATIVGVAEPWFAGLSLDSPDLWLPIERHPFYLAGSTLLTDVSGLSGVRAFGRLRSGETPASAEAELGGLMTELRRERPDAVWEGEWLRATPGAYPTGLMDGGRRGNGQAPRGELLTIFGLLGALALLILATACANLGGLLLARDVAREREMAIRAAVGAGRLRLVRQLLTESLVLALLGSAVGLACGSAVLRGLMVLAGAPPWLDTTPDWRVVTFAAGAAWTVALLFGLAPALHVARLHRSRTAAREVLIGIQVAASCVLVVVSSLLARGVIRASTIDPGFEVQRVLSVDPGLRAHGYTPARARAFFATLSERLGRQPGVRSVALAIRAPLSHVTMTIGTELDGHPLSLLVNYVSPEYFGTMGVAMLQGRTFARDERRALIVSDALARRAWPGLSPLGRPLVLGRDDSGAPAVFTVVGLVSSSRLPDANAPDALEAYLPIGPDEMAPLVALVRTSGPADGMASAAIGTTEAIDPAVFPEVVSLGTWLDRRVESTKYVALSVGALGILALVLACLGIFGLVAYAVAQRTTEIGIRVALGARPGHVLAVFGRRLLSPVAIGLALGIAGAAGLSQLLRAQLFGVSPVDPAAYVTAACVFTVAATLATLLPARRALRLDPSQILRHE